MATTVAVDVDHQLGLLVLGAHRRQPAAQPGALAGGERVALAQTWRDRDDILLQAGHQIAEQGTHIACAVLADHHVLAEHRDPAEGLGIAIVAHAMIFALGLDRQARLGTGTDELLVAVDWHGGDPAPGGDLGLILLLELGDVPLVQIGPFGRLRAGGDKREGDGGGKAVDAALVHCRVPLESWLEEPSRWRRPGRHRQRCPVRPEADRWPISCGERVPPGKLNQPVAMRERLRLVGMPSSTQGHKPITYRHMDS